MEKTNNKIIAVSFVLFSFFVGYIAKVMVSVLSNTIGAVARYANNPLIEHGVPLAIGVACFLYLILNKNIRGWAGDVLGEVSKVVWPSVNDTRSLTIVVCVIILVFSFVLSVFDFVSSEIVQFILELEV